MFYKERPPQSIPGGLDDYVVIVQTVKGKVHYCTLYNTHDKIPLFSAYQMHIGKVDAGRRQNNWYIEPQLSNTKEDDDMDTYSGTSLREQAINHDYKLSYWSKGHLNSNFFRTGEGRKATFALTNAVPHHPALNRLYWYEMEKQTKKMMYKYYFDIQGKPVVEIEDDEDTDEEGTGIFDTGRAYHITDAIPSGGNHLETFKRKDKVNIPHYVFTAACCFKPKKPIESFSFACLGINEADTRIQVLHVPNLEALLKQYFPNHVSVPENLDLFEDKCDYGTKNGDEIVKQIYAINALSSKNETGRE